MYEQINARQDNLWRLADVVVVCAGNNETKPRIAAANLALLKPAARILNLAGAGALAADIIRNLQLLSRVDNSLNAAVLPKVKSSSL